MGRQACLSLRSKPSRVVSPSRFRSLTFNVELSFLCERLDAAELRSSLGKLIAIEGIDQSGKGTQTRLLARKLRASGYATSIYDFPDYGTSLGEQLQAYLRGRNILDFHAVHLLYAANKWERAAEVLRKIEHGRTIIVNRYTPSNLAYGVTHGLSLEWLNSLEKDLPKPDLVLVLDVSPRTSFARKRRMRDIHEGDLAYLAKVRSAYVRLARRYGWKIINGERDQATVHSDLWRQVSRLL